MLEIKTRRIRHITIVDVIGRMSPEEDVAPEIGPSLDNAIRGLLDGGKKRILLNFTGVTYVDGSGIRELFGIATMARRRGGEVKLVNPRKTVRAALHAARLHTFFDITNDWGVALQTFSGPLAAAS